ncbi:LegC family aminotransferase [Acidobacteriota bacterium]
MIPLSVPHISGNEWEYIKECLDTGWVSSVGSYVRAFEEGISDLVGSRNAVACVNGTAALHVSLLVAGVKENQEVILPTVTFIAPVNAVHYIGAHPIFMDCDDFYNIDAGKTMDFLEKHTEYREGKTINRETGRTIGAVIPVHVFGNAALLKELLPFCRERNIKVIEDASESLGSFYIEDEPHGPHTGSLGDLGCLSFNGNKIITTGGGGMIVTKNDKMAERARYLTTQAKDDPVKYIHEEVGYNFRLTNVQAAMGVAQLERLHDYVEIKKRNYQTYKSAIDQIKGLELAELPGYAYNNHWMYALRIDRDLYGLDRDSLMDRLDQNGIQSRPLWELNSRQKPYRECFSFHIEKAKNLHEITLNIPCSVGLTMDEIEKVITVLQEQE